MISPYVRRRRLASERKQLMLEHSYSALRLATATRIPRQRISQIQNGHVGPSHAEMMCILNILRVGKRRWDEIMTITRDCRGEPSQPTERAALNDPGDAAILGMPAGGAHRERS